MVDVLYGKPNRKFVWAETIFLSMWFSDQAVLPERKIKFKKLVTNGQIEIVTGGWVMQEEAPRKTLTDGKNKEFAGENSPLFAC